jgi:flagellar hook-associated protein 2
MGISVGGLASGLDTDSIISKLVDLERRPIVQLQKREAAYQVQLTTYGSLHSLLGTLQSAAQALKDPAGLSGFTATSGNTSLFTASAGSTAASGSYNITVSQLAQSQKLKSAAFTSKTEAIGAGTLHLRVGSAAVKDITITATDTIEDVATAVNNAKAGVQASVVFDGTSYFLTLSAVATGIANVINLTATDSDGNNSDTAGLSRLVYDAGVTQNLTQTHAPLNALLEVDGVTGISRSSNTISDVITGVTLTLNSAPAAPGNASTLDISRDNSVLKGKIDAFIKAYNGVIKFFKEQQSYDVKTHQAGTLLGDGSSRLMRSKLSGLITTSVPGLPAGFRKLADLGMQSNAQEQLELKDSTKLDRALASDFDAVVRFFTQTTAGSEGLAVRLDKALNEFLTPGKGILAARQDGIAKNIERVQKQVAQYETRVADTAKRLRAQFTALETLLSSYKTTGDYLEQQIAGLQNLNSAIAQR